MSQGLACFSSDGLEGWRGTRLQGARGLVPAEGDPVFAQVRDRFFYAERAPYISSAASAASCPISRGLYAGQEKVQGGKLCQEAVLADVGVLEPMRVGRGGAGVPVAAPVGGLAVGPGRFIRRPQIPQASSPASR
jgi:hypothetical protein